MFFEITDGWGAEEDSEMCHLRKVSGENYNLVALFLDSVIEVNPSSNVSEVPFQSPVCIHYNMSGMFKFM